MTVWVINIEKGFKCLWPAGHDPVYISSIYEKFAYMPDPIPRQAGKENIYELRSYKLKSGTT